MEESGSVSKKSHKLMLSSRRTCNLTGISDVLSFDENEIVLETDHGMLTIKGIELHVNRLTLEKGEVDVDGRVDSLVYSDQTGSYNKGESILTRLFR